MSEAIRENYNYDSLDSSSRERLYSDDSLRQYLNEIGQIPVLDKGQVAELAHMIEVGVLAQERLTRLEGAGHEDTQDLQWLAEVGEQARDKLIESNLRLVVSIAKRYRSSPLPMLDRIQEGNLGLRHAVEKYDHRRGYEFSTYATYWIRQKILNAMPEQGLSIRVPRNVHSDLLNLRRLQQEYQAAHGVTPSLEQMAHELDMTQEQVTNLHRIEKIEPVSFDAPLGSDGETTLGEQLSNTPAGETVEEKALASDKGERARQLLLSAGLSEREAEIVLARNGLSDRYGYGQYMSAGALAEDMIPNEARIREINERAVYRLQAFVRRDPSLAEAFRDLLLE